MLEVVQFKFDEQADRDDLQWPLITPNGSPFAPQKPRTRTLLIPDGLEDIGGEDGSERSKLTAFWKSLEKKYQGEIYDSNHLSNSQTSSLPPNWTVVSISVSEDKNTMFVTRQRPNKDPLIFYIPLKGRRENEDDEHLTFENAITELNDIIQKSDAGTKKAATVRNDRERRAEWWADRAALDKRMKELLDNIEFCWLGAFKVSLTSTVAQLGAVLSPVA